MSTQPQAQQPMSFDQYKARLKKEVEVQELRARLAVAQFTELDASNRYNVMLSQIRETITTEVIPTTDSAEAHDKVRQELEVQPTFDEMPNDMSVEP